MRRLPFKIKNAFLNDSISKLLFIGSFVFLAIVFVSQICLKNSATREMFTDIEKYENIKYAENGVYKEGYVSVKLASGNPSDDLEIWFNGEPVKKIKSKTEKITVDCNGVIEIRNYGTDKIIACIDRKSDNVELMIENKPEISTGIKVLCSFKLK